MIKAIIFDCFGVLTADRWRNFIESLPATVDKEALKGLNRAYDSGHITADNYLKQIHVISGHEPAQVEEMLANQVGKNELLLAHIKALHDKGYKTGLLSNVGTNWIREHFLTEQEQAYFDDIILSYEVGLAKPDPAIFELACQRLGVQPQDTLLVDDVTANCQGAETLGMQSIVYRNLDGFETDLQQHLSAE